MTVTLLRKEEVCPVRMDDPDLRILCFLIVQMEGFYLGGKREV